MAAGASYSSRYIGTIKPPNECPMVLDSQGDLGIGDVDNGFCFDVIIIIEAPGGAVLTIQMLGE